MPKPGDFALSSHILKTACLSHALVQQSGLTLFVRPNQRYYRGQLSMQHQVGALLQSNDLVLLLVRCFFLASKSLCTKSVETTTLYFSWSRRKRSREKRGENKQTIKIQHSWVIGTMRKPDGHGLILQFGKLKATLADPL
jgi:hypothetical protein